jgi:hypothetical protein
MGRTPRALAAPKSTGTKLAVVVATITGSATKTTPGTSTLKMTVPSAAFIRGEKEST